MMIASNVGAELKLDAIPIHRDVKKTKNGMSPLECALGDGEDFELILTTSQKTANQILADAVLKSMGAEITKIGTVIERPGLWTQSGLKIPPSGWTH